MSIRFMNSATDFLANEICSTLSPYDHVSSHQLLWTWPHFSAYLPFFWRGLSGLVAEGRANLNYHVTAYLKFFGQSAITSHVSCQFHDSIFNRPAGWISWTIIQQRLLERLQLTSSAKEAGSFLLQPFHIVSTYD